MSETLQPLINKLERAKFTGRLIIKFYQGQARAACLNHYLVRDEFARHLPVVETEEQTVRPK